MSPPANPKPAEKKAARNEKDKKKATGIHNLASVKGGRISKNHQEASDGSKGRKQRKQTPRARRGEMSDFIVASSDDDGDEDYGDDAKRDADYADASDDDDDDDDDEGQEKEKEKGKGKEDHGSNRFASAAASDRKQASRTRKPTSKKRNFQDFSDAHTTAAERAGTSCGLSREVQALVEDNVGFLAERRPQRRDVVEVPGLREALEAMRRERRRKTSKEGRRLGEVEEVG